MKKGSLCNVDYLEETSFPSFQSYNRLKKACLISPIAITVCVMLQLPGIVLTCDFKVYKCGPLKALMSHLKLLNIFRLYN